MLPPPSDEQQACVDALIAGNNVVIRAEAGAGKSTTFFHAARGWIDHHPGSKVVLLCFNVNLRAASEQRLTDLGMEDDVHCYTIHSLASKMHGVCISDTMTLHKYVTRPCERTAPAPYSLCLIDEGQDLSLTMATVINLLQELTPMRYMVVGDARQAIYNFAREQDLDVLDRPETTLAANGAPWVTRELRRSYRLTKPITEFVNAHFRHPSNPAIEPGNTRSQAKQVMYVVGDRKNGDIVKTVVELLQTYAPEDIMVLAPSVRGSFYGCQELAHVLSETHRIMVHTTHRRLTDVNPELLKNKLVISSYHQSKGDERDCVVVLGVEAALHTRRNSPTLDGHVLVDNALHVALTRAREQLVVFQESSKQMYPSINADTLSQTCVVKHMAAPPPLLDVPPEPSLRLIQRSVSWLVEFAPEETLVDLAELLTVDSPVRLGPPVPCRPASVVRTSSGSTEDVWGFFPAAIMAAVQRQRLADESGPRSEYPSRLEAEVKSQLRKSPPFLPAVYRALWSTILAGDGPGGPRGWLGIAVMHHALVQHDFRHVLRQVSDFHWVGANETTYFERCVGNLLAVMRRHTGHVFFDRGKRESSDLKTRIQDEIPYCSGAEGEFYLPWQFSFQDEPSEEDMLRSAIYMWLHWTRHANIYCVPSNTLYKIHAPSDVELSRLVDRLLTAKRRADLEAERQFEQMLADFAEAAGAGQ